jgi:hypothetical protein
MPVPRMRRVPADSTTTLTKDIARLLTFTGKDGCRIVIEPGGAGEKCRLERQTGEGASLRLSPEVVGEAAARGLVRRDGDTLRLLPEARSFLRRFLAAREKAFVDQHRDIEIASLVDNDEIRPVRINAAESPLAQLSRLKDRAGVAWFTEDSIAAGMRLARDFQYAALQPRLTQTYEQRFGSGNRAAPGAGVEMKDSVVAARLRVAGAVTAMGPDLAGVALDACCFEKGLETIERERQWPARSAKLMLKTALMALHRHYSPPPARPVHAWGDEGFRPDLG